MFEMMLTSSVKTRLPIWKKLSSGNVPASNAGCMFAANNYVYYLTGKTTPEPVNSELWRYGIADEKWVKLDCPMAYQHMRTFGVVNGEVYFFGGIPQNKDVWKYVISTGEWVKLAPFTYSFYGGMGTVVGTDIYIAGGVNGSTWLTNFVKYDTLTNTVQILNPLPIGLNSGAMWSFIPGEIIITNGNPSNSQPPVRVIRKYTTTNGWTTQTLTGDDHKAAYPGYTTVDSKGYLFGGTFAAASHNNDFTTFDGTKFSTIGKTINNPSPRGRANLTVYDGVLYMFGGNSGNDLLNEFWAYPI